MNSIPSLSILNSVISENVVGYGITKLHPRSLFQSIGDYFARKSGNERISFIVIGESTIKNIHTRGNEILEVTEILNKEIADVKSWNKSSHDPKQFDVQLSIQKPGKKEGEYTNKTYDFEIFPAFLGTNSSKIEKLAEIIEHKNQFENLIQFFENWKK